MSDMEPPIDKNAPVGSFPNLKLIGILESAIIAWPWSVSLTLQIRVATLLDLDPDLFLNNRL